MWIRLRPALPVLALLVALALAATVARGVALQAEEKLFLPLVARRVVTNPDYTIRQRFGIGVAPSWPGDPSFPGLLSDFDKVEQLGFGWYTDWTYRTNPEQPQGIEFVQLVAVYSGSGLQGARGPRAWQLLSWPQNSTGLQAAIEANPGALWIIGNEPETRGQGELTPEEYADIYHDAYHFVKSIDPTAQVAIGGVVMPSPLRLQWLDRCLVYYQQTYGETMPIDVWNTHMQILRERECEGNLCPDCWGCGVPFGLFDPNDGVCTEGTLYEVLDNCSLQPFQELITEFCIWLNEKGERGKPVIISEYGVLMPSEFLLAIGGDQAVVDFMQGTFEYMLHTTHPTLGWAADGGRLIQRWAWFSLNVPPPVWTGAGWVGFNGWLYDWEVADDFSVFGEAYRDYILSQ